MVNIKELLENTAKAWNKRHSEYRSRCYKLENENGYIPDYMKEHLEYLTDKTFEYMRRAENA